MLLFFDIDGTLFDDSRTLPASVLPALEKAHGNGHLIFINTGRTLCNLDHRLDGFPVDGWIMGCGTRVVFRGKTLQSMEYDLPLTLRLRQVFLSLEIPVVYECDTAMYFDPLAPGHPAIPIFRNYARKNGIDRDITETDPEFRAVKMFCFSDTRDLIDRLEKATAAIGLPYTAIDRGKGGWEVIPAAFSKGTGIDLIRRKLNIPLEDCFAFGDSRNDMTMFEHVGHSIAMGNAPEDVKAACSWTTALPEDDGIKKAMIHFGIIADE
ncbi:MAG: HAD family phosphatase [Clostridia bacterium]|nr:HAD family phosphatase [Clostridia bacterium]